MDRRPLAVCAIFKNEAPYLLEWIAYHRVIGFDRFVLYDNGSSDGGADLIRRSPLADRATVIHWPQRPGQLSAYRHFIDIFAPAYEWAAFIDLDEFILPLGGATLADTLQRCGHASAVLVNWRVFGPAGHEHPAPGLVIESYDLRAEDALPVNRHVKSIARCADLLDVTQNPHEFRLKGKTCNPLGQEVPNIGVQPAACHQGLAINHYYTKSRREWLDKVQRGSATSGSPEPIYTEEVFDHLSVACTVKDEAIKAYAPAVRALLGGVAGPDAGVAPAAPAEPLPATAQRAPTSPLVAPAPAAPPFAAPTPADATGAVDAAAPPGQGPAEAGMPPPGTPPLVAGAALRPAAPAPSPLPPSPAPGWNTSEPDAQERMDGLALVFRDHSRPGAPWLAALRGAAAGLVDPEFLLDETGRLRDFSSAQEARAACEAALADYQLV